MAYSLYDGYQPPDSPSKAGKARAATAKRDQWGRFLPNQGKLKPPTHHGYKGGITRCKQAKRNEKGQFV